MRKIVLAFLVGVFYHDGMNANNVVNEASSVMDTIVVAAERYKLYLPLLRGKKVGLLVNATSRANDQHLVDFLLSKNIDVRMIFAPEHGFRGDKGAGEAIIDGMDKKTGLPIISLHGRNKKPTAVQMQQLDVVIFDIQDVGVRYYTYISSMHYLMEACVENKVPLLILDRPNPNGDYIDGPVLQSELKSFIGMHPIPIVHGLTVGELAKMINGEGWLLQGEKCDLTVIKVDNYNHDSIYSLPVKPSPNLPNDLSVRLYPSLGFFEATSVSVGRGTPWPFQVLGYPNSKMGAFSFTPKTISGSWSDLNYAGKKLYGQKLAANDPSTIKIKHHASQGIDLSYILAWKKMFDEESLKLINRPLFMDKLSGTTLFKQQILENISEKKIKLSWKIGLQEYQKIRKRYLLYPDSQYMKAFDRED